MTKTILTLVLAVLVAVPPASAQGREADTWRTFAGQLEPNAFVSVRLKSGKSFRGHIVRVSDDAIQVNPKARVAAPLRHVAYQDITSIKRQKEGGWSPATKVLVVVGVSAGVLAALAMAAMASLVGGMT